MFLMEKQGGSLLTSSDTVSGHARGISSLWQDA